MTSGFNLDRLTNKKKEYLNDAIIDKNGAYSYLEDPLEYKKARKRLQNRESAVRSRQRKKNYQEILEGQIDDQKLLIDELKRDKSQLQESNAALTSENSVLKQQIAYFQETFANQNLIGGCNTQTVIPTVRDDVIHKEDLDQFKLELLQKINSRFLEEEDDKEKSLDSSKTKDEIITPEKFEDDTTSMVFDASIKDPMELMAGDFQDNKR